MRFSFRKIGFVLIGVFASFRAICAEDVVMQVIINRVMQPEAVVLVRTTDGRLLASADQLSSWRVRRPELADRVISGKEYFDLFLLDQARVSVNQTQQIVDLSLPASAFERTQRAREQVDHPTSSVSELGGFLSYDLSWQRTPDISDPLATIEIGAFSGFGNGSSQFLVNNQGKSAIRLETAWNVDFPDSTTSLRVGDSISRPAEGWGRSLRYGGVRFGTNFSINPGLSILPTQAVEGLADVPSTVDVFVNNALVTQQDVPPGPFSIGSIPVSTGPGVLKVVVRDILGREQIIEQSIFGSALLLRPGLSDYSIEIGRLRDDFGLRSSAYGDRFGAATFRRGIRPYLTSEAHLEVSENRAFSASVGAALGAGSFGTLSLTAIRSSVSGTSGSGYALAIQAPGKRINTAAVVQYSSSTFWQLGQTSDERRPRLSASVIVGVPIGVLGSANFAYLSRSFHGLDRRTQRVFSFGWSRVFGKQLYAGVSFQRSIENTSSTSGGVFFNLVLDPRTTSSLFIEEQNRNLTFQRSLPTGRGWGYRASSIDENTFEVGTSYQNDATSLSLDLSRQRSVTSSRLGARGSVVWFDKHLFTSRQMSDGFALVRVGSLPGVKVYNGNQWVGTTDRRGMTVIPRLLPYQKNVISIDDADIPLDMEIGALEKIAIPRFRSGVSVTFDIRPQHAVELRVVRADGQPVAPGAIARIDQTTQMSRVGVDGRLFLSGLKFTDVIRIESAETRCGVIVSAEPSDEFVPDLGTLVCREDVP